jgi:protocatechuate 3,4-dioxygenase beta subunit
MLSVPGREEGLQVKTDESGNYEIRNINPLDFAGLTAHAPSHTRIEKTELQFVENSRVRMDFQLDEGFEISGVVVDPHGNPVRGASIICAALSQKSPQEQKTYTNAEGVFVAEGLMGGMFNVIIEADGYQRAEEKPVEAGTLDLKITVEKLGSVYVTAYGRNRRPLDRFLCSIKPALDGQTTYGKPMLTKEATAPKDGTELITGLIPLTYVAEVSARGYAKNFSPKFTIIEGQTDPVSVEVQLNQGGTLRGVVNDTSGKPIQGVSVSTMPHDLIENPLIIAFGGAPYTITRSTVKTNKKGIYEFKLLHPGDYQLKYMHVDYCTAFTKKNMAEIDQERDLPPVALERGCEVSGIAQLNAKPTGQVKVHISAEHKEGTLSTFNTEATTDNEGRFLMPKRLPAGKYVYRAAQMGLGPFMIMAQYQKTTPFEIQPSEDQLQLLVTVPVINK